MLRDDSSKLSVSDSACHPKDTMNSIFPKLTGRKRMLSSSSVSTEANAICYAANTDSYNNNVVNAIRSRDVDRLRELLNDQDQCFDVCNINGEYLIHLACRRGDLETIKFLVLEAGVDVHVTDNLGRSILHDACWRPELETEILRFLLQVVDPTYLVTEDVRGHTPLDYTRHCEWPSWNSFLSMNRDLILKRMMKMSSPTREASN